MAKLKLLIEVRCSDLDAWFISKKMKERYGQSVRITKSRAAYKIVRVWYTGKPMLGHYVGHEMAIQTFGEGLILGRTGIQMGFQPDGVLARDWSR